MQGGSTLRLPRCLLNGPPDQILAVATKAAMMDMGVAWLLDVVEKTSRQS